MSKNCLFCDGHIPLHRKSSARYCSDEHYYEAKKSRSNARYASMRSFTDHVIRNHKILELAKIVQEFDGRVDMQALDTLGFDWGVSTGDFCDRQGRIFKKVGEQYAYWADPNSKVVEIWKVK